jgi:hypothetical protein
MKIGIITTHHALNCGAVLQAYASQFFLTNLGHQVEFIDYEEPYKRPLRNYISKSLIKTFHNWQDLYNGYKYKRRGEFNEILNIGPIHYTDINELKKNPPKYDLYYAGSDQIWTVASRKKVVRPNYLDFGDDTVKRISYAASLGQGIVPEFMKDEIKGLLLKFNHISVRETSGVKVIQNIIGDYKKVHHVVDPTLLLTAKDYQSIVEKVNTMDNFIVCYSLAAYKDEHIKMLTYIQEKTGLPIKNLRNPDNCIRLKKAQNIIVTPYTWLGYIKKCNLVICTSFHAVVFSLIFHKPFVVVSPYVNKRIMSLLSLVELEDRFIEHFNEQKIDLLLKQKIDWKDVDNKLAKNRESSIDYLINAINN